MPAAAHSALSYSKWDQLEASDDESDAQEIQPMLHSTKTLQHKEMDERVAQRFMAHQERYKDAVPAEHRSLIARFIAVTDRREQACNIYRYSEITAFCIQARCAFACGPHMRADSSPPGTACSTRACY